MTVRQDYEIEELTILDSEKREIGLWLRVCVEIEYDEDDDLWFPIAVSWELDGRDPPRFGALRADADRATWHLFELAWDAGKFGEAAWEKYREDM